MTKQEHALIIAMFARERMYVKSVLELLKSRNIIEGDDLPAFYSAVRFDSEKLTALVHETSEEYGQLAKAMGITEAIGGF